MNRDIDRVIAKVRDAHPGITVEQLPVRHPGADDDGLWFFRHPADGSEVQLESSTGAVPFLVESEDALAATANSVDEAVSVVVTRLGLENRTA